MRLLQWQSMVKENRDLPTIRDDMTYVPEHCEFKFVSNLEVRSSLQRSYDRSRACFDHACYPWVVFFAGRSIEIILFDLLDANWVNALSSPKAPKNKSDISSWDLSDMIAVATDLGLAPPSVASLSPLARYWRSGLVPAFSFEVWKEEARVALDVFARTHAFHS